jgi:histidinol-phosphatase
VAADDLTLALELADLAAAISLDASRWPDLGVDVKPDGSPVTEADRIVEQAIRDALARQRPGDRIVGEEYGGTPGDGGRCWYLDPIDGTSAFIERTGRWSTLIALAVDGAVTVGVADFPARGHRYRAARGVGAFADGERISVSPASRLADATVCDDYRHHIERGVADHPLVRVAAHCPAVHPHAGHSMLVVASGDADIAVGSGGGAWDYAPFVVIVAEAGGRTSDFQGRPRFDTGSLVATSGPLHAEVLAML